MNTLTKTTTSSIIFNCDKYGYEASTATVLKRHMTTKHKNNSTTPEKSRNSDLDESLKLSPINEDVRPTVYASSFEEKQ